jgi:FAD/FMN-containing dehydrogenase
LEVSLALTALLDAGRGAGDWHIAIRSGGHSQTGSNNIANGVTIDLSMMNSSQYDKITNTARLEPGGRWEHVYANLQSQGVTVTGGRDGGVGVGGYLLGGGLSFFFGRMGFACDSITNYEVVLTNGSIIYANATANSDLWRALKGGGSNFGIVTRYDLEAIPSRSMSYDLRILAANYSDAVLETVGNFANQNETFGDNALVTFLTHNTSISQSTTIGVIHINTLGYVNADPVFDNLNKLPALKSITTLQNMAEAAGGSKLPAGGRYVQPKYISSSFAAKLHVGTPGRHELLKTVQPFSVIASSSTRNTLNP